MDGKNIDTLRKDYVGAKLYEIAENDKKDTAHFIFKKGKQLFGISVKEFDTFLYKETTKKKGRKNDIS